MQQPDLSLATWIGRTTALGMMCGVIGINVGHELGHRTTRWEQGLAKLLLLSSQYTHFFIDHNRGHHKHVATPEDPTTARLGESVYLFWLRAIPGSYRSAWRIQNQDRKRKGYGFWSFKNEMVWYAVAQISVLVAAYYFAGGKAALGLALAAGWGILLLETVNYIEHYGLLRNKVNAFRYESVRPVHSWNSDHIAGRLVLFELTRHSDHHYLPHKKYPLLDSIEEAPQLPAGYPGMMVMALLPPLWFAVMNPRVQALSANIQA
jgi:alkane 1-monooxygenase